MESEWKDKGACYGEGRGGASSVGSISAEVMIEGEGFSWQSGIA